MIACYIVTSAAQRRLYAVTRQARLL